MFKEILNKTVLGYISGGVTLLGSVIFYLMGYTRLMYFLDVHDILVKILIVIVIASPILAFATGMSSSVKNNSDPLSRALGALGILFGFYSVFLLIHLFVGGM